MPEPLASAPVAPLDMIEWRVDSEPYERDGGNVCRYVPYVDAALVATLLDQWVGPDGWADAYEAGDIAGKFVLWCRLTINGVTKMDVGKPSNMESEKGCVSDAFKRAACLKWGIARNVYELPTVFAHCRTFTSQGNTKAAADGKRTLDDIARKLKSLGYSTEGGRISDEDSEPPVKPFDLDKFKQVCDENGVDPTDVVAHAGLGKKLADLTEDDRPALKASLAELAAEAAKGQGDPPDNDVTVGTGAVSLQPSQPELIAQ